MPKLLVVLLVAVMVFSLACTGSVPDYEKISEETIQMAPNPMTGEAMQRLQVTVSTANVRGARAIANNVVKKSGGAYDKIIIGIYSQGTEPGVADPEHVFGWEKGRGLRQIR